MCQGSKEIWFCVLFMVSRVACCYATLEDAKALRTDLLKNYSKYIRPVKDQTKPVYVAIQLSVIAIQEFDEVLERFSVAGAFFVYWEDENIEWEPSDYGGISTVFMGYKEVWVPEIILTNPSEKIDSYGKEWQLIRYDSKGIASWTPGDLIKATCSIDVRYFPFDIQECGLELYTWGYSVTEVRMISIRNDIETGLLGEHSSWKVINTTAKAADTDFVSKVTFTFQLERKPQYLIVNVMLPILFLCLLNVLVFLLPAESGERVSYAITVLLSIAVFMTIVSSTLPKSSEPLPIIAYFLMIDLIISALISVLTVLNLRIFHKNNDILVPKWLTYMYNFLSCNCRRNRSIVPNEKDRTEDTTEILKFSKRNAYSENDNTVDSAKLNAAIAKVDPASSSKQDKIITWQDISVMFDYILFVIFTLFTLTSFIILLLITKYQRQ